MKMPTCQYCGRECAPSVTGLCVNCDLLRRAGAIRRCWHCDRYFPVNTLTRVETNYGETVDFCDGCIEVATRTCSFCGQRFVVWQGQAARDGSGQYSCPSCGYTACSQCGVLSRTVHYMMEQPYCDKCVDHDALTALNRVANEELLKRFDFKPRFNKYAVGSRDKDIFLGVELEAGFLPTEVDRAKILCTVNDISTGRAYTKHDGSVPSWGFEVVTHPMSLKYHKERFPWAEVLDKMSSAGMRVEPTQEELNDDDELHEHPCGLHVHINKESLTSNQWIKLDWLIQSNKNFWYTLARRGHTRYAKFKSLRYVRTGERKLSEVCGISYTRYFSVNFCNTKTVELRFFNSTLDKSVLLATLELAHALVTWAREVTITDILKYGAAHTYVSWVHSHKGIYPTASEYITRSLNL